MSFRDILALLALTILVIFSIQNATSTEVSFLIWDFSLPRVLLIVISFLVGALVAYARIASRGVRKSLK